MYGCGRMNRYRVLQTDMDYLTAALIKVRVFVWHDLDDQGYIIEYGLGYNNRAGGITSLLFRFSCLYTHSLQTSKFYQISRNLYAC